MEYLLKGQKPEDVGYTPEQYIEKAKGLREDAAQCEKAAFDMIVRKVIDSGLVYKNCSHKEVKKVKHDPDRFLTRSEGIFQYHCEQCGLGVNRHDCHIEGETYYMTCDEARVVNMAARTHGIMNGSIKTATSFRD